MLKDNRDPVWAAKFADRVFGRVLDSFIRIIGEVAQLVRAWHS